MYTVMNVLHVVTAVFLVGPMAILPMSALRMVRVGNAVAVERTARSTLIFSIASLAVFVFGFGLIEAAPAAWDLSLATPWVLISIILYFVALALSLFAVVPALRSVAEHLAASGEVPAADLGGTDGETSVVARNDYRRIAITSGIVSLLLLAVVVLMVVRP